MIALLLACAPTPCDEGFVRDGASCAAYVASDPLPPAGPPFPTGLTWQWQLTGSIDRSIDVDVYDIDLFDATDADLQGLRDDGRLAVCYLSAGSTEAWRPDAATFPPDSIGRRLDGWPDERWLDPMDPGVRAALEARFDLAVSRGCHAVEPDNVTAFQARSGFPVNATEQLDFNRFLSDAARARGLAIALKNDVDQIPELVEWFDFAVNEECAFYEECDANRPFVDAGRAVLHAEYVDDWDDRARRLDAACGVEPGLSTIVKTWDLGSEYATCD